MEASRQAGPEKTYGLDIVEAAERAGAALMKAGLVVEVDMNPRWRAAQKFEDWERKGVQVRIEVGLREAESGISIRCVLSCCYFCCCRRH